MPRTGFIVGAVGVVIVAGIVAIPLLSGSTTPSPSASPVASAGASADPNGLVGTGCAGYESEISGLADKTAAQAIAATPTLSSFNAALTGATNPGVTIASKLGGPTVTVFAPVDSAFAKLPIATLANFKNPADAGALTKILEFHLLSGEFVPASIAGTHTTLQGETLTVTATGSTMQVNGANVVCGGIHTSNATLYLIDSVLAPPIP